MEYSELKEQTWIYFDNKYHFVQELNEGFIRLAYSPIEYIPILKTRLPNDAKIVEPNKYVVNETVLYIGEHETAYNKTGVIKFVTEYASYSPYQIHIGDEMIWASPFDLAPIHYYTLYQMYRHDKELKGYIKELQDYYDQWPQFTEGEQALYHEQTVTVLHKKYYGQYEIKVDEKTETVHVSALTKLSN